MKQETAQSQKLVCLLGILSHFIAFSTSLLTFVPITATLQGM